MWEQLTDEAFIKPASIVLALLLFLILLKKVNKVLLIVGIGVTTAMYLIYNQPDWLKPIIDSFKI